MRGPLIVLTPNLYGHDGISTVVRQMLGCWPDGRRSGLEVWVLNDSAGGTAGELPPANYRFAERSKMRFTSWSLGHGLSDQRSTSVIVMHLALAPVALPLTLRGASLAVFLHGVEAWRPLRKLEACALTRSYRLIANSEYTVDRFKASNPSLADRDVAICPLGTDAPVKASRALTGLPSLGRFALIVGRMSSEERYKGHDLLLDLWPDVLCQIPDARLVIVGDGDDRSRLEQKASSLTAEDRVMFLGRVSDEELPYLYQECAFFVMPSRGEGFGLVFLEAMQAGKACVGGLGAAEEVIEDGVTGITVDPANRVALRNAIVRLFKDPQLAAQMGRAGAERVAERFTSDHFRQRILALLEAGKESQ